MTMIINFDSADSESEQNKDYKMRNAMRIIKFDTDDINLLGEG